MIYNVIDNFVDDFNALRVFADTANFGDVDNPHDGVTYPLICKELPANITQEIAKKLTKILGRMVKINATFMRLSTEGVHVPHIAHHDKVMGDYSLMLYLNTQDNAGTSFLRHNQTGMCYAPEDQTFIDMARRDQNKKEAWTRTISIEMKANRALIFDAGYFHCAEPIGGFGQDQRDGRVVLTCFFS